MKITVILSGNCLQRHVVYLRNERSSISSISRDYISLQAPCQIFINEFIWLEASISRSVDYNARSHSIYMTCRTALLLLTFIIFRVLNNLMSYGRSKGVSKVDKFDRSKFFKGRNVDVSISLKKIAVILPGNCLQHLVVYIRKWMFLIYFISRDNISLQVPCQIFAEGSPRVGRPISHSIDSDVSIHWTYLGCDGALLPLIFIAFRFPLSWQNHELWSFQMCDRIGRTENPKFGSVWVYLGVIGFGVVTSWNREWHCHCRRCEPSKSCNSEDRRGSRHMPLIMALSGLTAPLAGGKKNQRDMTALWERQLLIRSLRPWASERSTCAQNCDRHVSPVSVREKSRRCSHTWSPSSFLWLSGKNLFRCLTKEKVLLSPILGR
jgi:hypothetical protein